MAGPRSAGNYRGENPTNVRNGADLVNAAVDAMENDRCRTAVIQPQGQLFYLDCRQRSYYDFIRHMPIFTLRSGNDDQWLSRKVKVNGGWTFRPHPPPNPQSTAHFNIGPHVARFYKSGPQSENDKLGSHEAKLAYLLLLEGASGRAIQMFRVAFSVGEAAAIAFKHLANGYSVVFAGIVLRESIDKDFTIRPRREYAPGEDLKGLEEVSNNQEIDRFSSKNVVGIIY